MRNFSSKNQVTVCKGDICMTVAGEVAKALAVVALIGIAVSTLSEISKLLK